MNKELEKSGDTRNERGQFLKGVSGNLKGKPKGIGLSITSKIKQELEKCPEGKDKKTYLELLVRKILKKAIIDGDQVMIKSIWNYIDGLPKENLDITSGGDKLTFLLGEIEKEKRVD